MRWHGRAARVHRAVAAAGTAHATTAVTAICSTGLVFNEVSKERFAVLAVLFREQKMRMPGTVGRAGRMVLLVRLLTAQLQERTVLFDGLIRLAGNASALEDHAVTHFCQVELFERRADTRSLSYRSGQRERCRSHETPVCKDRSSLPQWKKVGKIIIYNIFVKKTTQLIVYNPSLCR